MFDLTFCIFGCDTIDQYKQQIIKIEETWGKKALEYSNVKVLYFLGEEETDLKGSQFVHLKGVKNDYVSSCYKQFLGFKYIHEHVPSKFVFCCGTDTYVNIPKILNLISELPYEHEQSLYIGGHGDFRSFKGKQIYFHSGGGGFLLSSKALKDLCLLDFYNQPDIMQEWFEICENNSWFTGAADVVVAWYLHLEHMNCQIIKYQDEFKHCTYKGHPCCYGKNYPPKLVTCHNMSLQDFDDFTSILETHNYFV